MKKTLDNPPDSLDRFCKRYCKHYIGYDFTNREGRICSNVNLAGNAHLHEYTTSYPPNDFKHCINWEKILVYKELIEL